MLRKVAVHEALALLVLVAAVGNTETPDPGEHTAPVTTGTVTSTVEVAGNLDSPRTVGVTFNGTPGLVTKLPVHVGDEVAQGQELAEVDNRAATRQLELAQAALVTAKGQLATARETLDGDKASVGAALRTYRNAIGAARDAAQKLHVDADGQDNLVEAQQLNLDANRRDETVQRSSTASRTRLRNATTTTNAPAAPPNFPGTLTTDTNSVTAQRQRSNSVTRSTTRSAVAAAGVQLTGAQATRATTIVTDEQNVRQMVRAAKLARADVAVALAANGVGHRCSCAPGLIQQAKGAVKNAQAQIDQAKDALADTVLKAPFKGTVIDIAGDVGETPAAAARGTASPPASPNGPGAVEDRRPATESGFLVLADLSHRAVTAQVAEKDIRKIKTGQSAQVTFPATGAVVAGTVSFLDLEETVVNHVVEYNVKIDLDGRAVEQMLGQSASVVITTASHPDVLKVPGTAVHPTADGKGTVTVKRGDDYLKVPVAVGLVGDDSTEVSSPLLKPGDLVVYSGRSDGGA
jgi:multidrug efflux pump subunit AcrA (membrane-fusion protein)